MEAYVLSTTKFRPLNRLTRLRICSASIGNCGCAPSDIFMNAESHQAQVISELVDDGHGS